MKYIARSEGQYEGRPQQGVGNCIKQMRTWAKDTANKTRSTVTIYALTEVKVETVDPEPEPPKAA
jgi:hypothetical protein